MGLNKTIRKKMVRWSRRPRRELKTHQRVKAGSRVNFIFLNEDEQVERYKNMI